MTRKRRPMYRAWWSDVRSWIVIAVFVFAGPLWALLAFATAWGLNAVSISRGLNMLGAAPLAYVYLALPCLLIGVAAVASFQLRGRVLLADVVIASLIVGLSIVAFSKLSSEGEGGTAAPHVIFPVVAALGCWLLVCPLRKQSR